MKVTPALEPEHGSYVITRDGLVGVVIGIPRPPELLPIIPKYVICRESLWARGGSGFCRILEMYGPRGVSDTLARIGFKEYHDGIYNSPMPYVRMSDVVEVTRPRDALANVTSRPSNELHYELLEVLGLLTESGVELSNVGLTGSLAIGIENVRVSDIDLVVYGSGSAEIAYQVFRGLGGSFTHLGEFGGLKVKPGVSIGWRRARFKRYIVGWVGVPGVGELCEPIRSYFSVQSPTTPVDLVVVIERAQAQALTYPPCVMSRDGVYVVSFEYNVGALLYEGGVFRIRGLADRGAGVVYLATREMPGFIELIG
jgi:hypothetical protein